MTSTVEDLSSAQVAQRVEHVREIASLVLSKYGRAYLVDCIRNGRQPTELLSALAEADLLGIGVPEDLGGSGGGLQEELALVETVALSGITPEFLIIPNFARKPVMRYGTPEQIATFVATTLRPDQRPCFAITEPDAGTNSFRLRTNAVEDLAGWRINGQKVFISGALEAREMLLVARTAPFDETKPTAGLSLFIVDLTSPGVTLHAQRIESVAPCSQCEVFLDDVVVPADAIVGEPGKAARYLFAALNPERVLTAGMAIGLGDYVLGKGADYARIRAPFGRPIGSYQGVAHPLARAKIGIEAARLAAYEAAKAYDAGRDAGLLANVAKFLGSEAAYAALDATIQAHGGYAFDRDYDLALFLEPIRLMRVAPINNEMILNYVAERSLDLPRSY